MSVERLRLKSGELVEVRSRAEILDTLDETGSLDGLPFMPEMLAFCGQQFRVYKRAHKACDTIEKTGCRRMDDAVHLEGVRCDGTAHGGCQAACLIFWKDAWLKRAGKSSGERGLLRSRREQAGRAAGCTEDALRRTTVNRGAGDDAPVRYRCQATELRRATRPLAWWNPRQYLEDITSRNFTIGQVLGGLLFRAFTKAISIKGYRALLWAYNRIQRLRGGKPYPLIDGRLTRTPTARLGLRPGDLVRVKTREEISETLDKRNRNRGLLFDPEMAPYCGEQHRVLQRVERIISEQTGEMMELPNPCIILEGVVCRSLYSGRRIGCPRAIYSYWREIWLAPVDGDRAD